MIAFARMPDPSPHENITKAFAVDIESSSVGQESERSELEQHTILHERGQSETNWPERNNGTGWRAEIQIGGGVDLDWFWRYWNKCVEWIGAKTTKQSFTQFRLRILDSDTNHVRYQSPLFVDATHRIAGNGASYAVMTYHGELSVWSAKSIIRWPWALAASLGTLLFILLWGRWRSKRLVRSALSHEPGMLTRA